MYKFIAAYRWNRTGKLYFLQSYPDYASAVARAEFAQKHGALDGATYTTVENDGAWELCEGLELVRRDQ